MDNCGGARPASGPSEADNSDGGPSDGGASADDTSVTDPVRAALAGAQRMARSRPARKRGRPLREEAGPSRRGGYSGPGPDQNDPAPVGDVILGYVSDRGWDRPLAEAKVFADWPSIVGTDVAAHCTPTTLRDGELRITAESTAWATQLRLLAGTLLARIVAELGPTVVTKVIITGPTVRQWSHGKWSVHGARGPRDTYG